MSRSWLETREIGARWGIRFLVGLSTALGRAAPRLFLHFIAFYYLLLNRRAVRASREYLARLDQPTGLGTVYRHFLRFAQCTLDRLFFLRERYDYFDITRNGREHLSKLDRTKTGAILLGAHLGSFEALRAAAADEKLSLNVLGYFRNAPIVNEFFDAGGSNTGPRFIDIGESPVKTALEVKRLVDRGELVAILADRAGVGDTATVDFLGAPAALPTGPYALAATLKCPVYLTFGLYYSPNRYDLYCEPFAERVSVPRADRKKALAAYAQSYAKRLEHFCRLAPDNWFNFFDFWEDRHVGSS